MTLNTIDMTITLPIELEDMITEFVGDNKFTYYKPLLEKCSECNFEDIRENNFEEVCCSCRIVFCLECFKKIGNEDIDLECYIEYEDMDKEDWICSECSYCCENCEKYFDIQTCKCIEYECGDFQYICYDCCEENEEGYIVEYDYQYYIECDFNISKDTFEEDTECSKCYEIVNDIKENGYEIYRFDTKIVCGECI